jgi:multidrug efflux system membrane fusion protein
MNDIGARAAVLIGLICLADLSAGCRQQGAVTAAPLTPVTVSGIGTHDAGSRTPYSAGIVPFSQVDLAFKSGGYVESILQLTGADGRVRNIQEGDRVARGAVLARVRENDYVASVNAAKAQLTQAEATLEQARLDFERTDALFRTDSVTTPQHDAARAKLDTATAGVNGAMSGLSQAETALSDCAIRAPLDAWVTKRNVEVGSLVGPTVLGFSLADTRLVKAVFGVPDVVVGNLKLGAPQAITTPAATGQFVGRITSIAPAADARTRTFSIEVTLSNADNVLRPGMVATLMLSGPRDTEPVPVLPLSAVVRAADDPSAFGVFVVEQRGDQFFARARTVQLGVAYGNVIGLERGVKPGERIITTGATQVRDGQQVRVLP